MGVKEYIFGDLSYLSWKNEAFVSTLSFCEIYLLSIVTPDLPKRSDSAGLLIRFEELGLQPFNRSQTIIRVQEGFERTRDHQDRKADLSLRT